MGIPVKEFIQAVTLEKLPRVILEAPKSAVDFGCLANLVSLTFLAAATPRGDGHPVILSPGMGGDKGSLALVKAFLELKGYDVRPWGLGRNLGRWKNRVQDFLATIESVHDETGLKPSLVGHSMGGTMAECAASRAPEKVRQVITLASPVNTRGDKKVMRAVLKLMEENRIVEEGGAGDVLDLLEDFRIAKGEHNITTTHVYTGSDPIIEKDTGFATRITEQTDNIEVRGSHVGMAFNVAVFYIIGQKLALKEGEQTPFPYQKFRGIMPQKPFHLSEDRSYIVDTDGEPLENIAA